MAEPGMLSDSVCILLSMAPSRADLTDLVDFSRLEERIKAFCEACP